MSPAAEAKLTEAMALLQESAEPKEPTPEINFRLRIMKRGDIALLAHRLVMADSTADEAATLARAASFLSDYDPRRDIGWIAEQGGSLAGACLLKGGNEGSAELAMIHVEPEASGSGLAELLIESCMTFAEVAKYEEVTARVHEAQRETELALATNGFRLVRNAQNDATAEVGRLWTRKLRGTHPE